MTQRLDNGESVDNYHVPCCAVLPSGDLMVAGGWTGDTKAHSKRMWIGNN